MMGDPLDMPQSAFDPFFAKRLAFCATRTDGTHRGTVKACIFDEGYADLIDGEAATSSRIGRIVFHVAKLEWAAALSTPPQTGDRFVSPDTGKEYALLTADAIAGDTWSIDAREVAS